MAGNVRLYKYLDIKGGLAMLHNSNLQFTNSTRLNDPFDCHPSLFDFSNVPVNEYNWPPADFLKGKGMIDMENLRCILTIVKNRGKVYDNHNNLTFMKKALLISISLRHLELWP